MNRFLSLALAAAVLALFVLGCNKSQGNPAEKVGFGAGKVAVVCIDTKMLFETPFAVEMALPSMGETFRLMMYERASRRYCGELRLRDDSRNLWIVRLEQDAAFDRMTVTYMPSVGVGPKTIVIQPDDQRVYTFIIGAEIAPLITIRPREETDPPLLPAPN